MFIKPVEMIRTPDVDATCTAFLRIQRVLCRGLFVRNEAMSRMYTSRGQYGKERRNTAEASYVQ